MSLVRSYNEHVPNISDTAFVAPSTTIIGQVTLAENTSVWFGTVLRGDVMPITIGARSNIQDLCMAHGTSGQFGVIVGEDVTVGHRAVLHGCTIGNNCLIGMGSVILDGSIIGEGSIIAAGAVVAPGTEVPPGSLFAGVPGKKIRDVSAEAQEAIRHSARHYIDLAATYSES